MTTIVLPQQIYPVTPLQARLTARFLRPAIDDIEILFKTLRAETDAVLAPRFPDFLGKPWPLSRCREITNDVVERLDAWLKATPPVHKGGPADRGLTAIRRFLNLGGQKRRIWGVLRESYFQNALQVGGLYIDSANDTVTPTKPKVEILPIDACGLVPVRDAWHFADTARKYWGITCYANHLVPSLAPILPMIALVPPVGPMLQSNMHYMIELFRMDRFAKAQSWLAEGPPPPPELAQLARECFPADLLSTGDGRADAVETCRDARRRGLATRVGWVNGCLGAMDRAHGAVSAAATRRATTLLAAE
ncbi:MAG: hypothetical protein RLY86_284 [Pseudomonadota bacterium]|jgi:hypothetical protein